ncbi:hypothetical protein ACSQ67_010055 [Phaseolus vulgaris]
MPHIGFQDHTLDKNQFVSYHFVASKVDSPTSLILEHCLTSFKDSCHQMRMMENGMPPPLQKCMLHTK